MLLLIGGALAGSIGPSLVTPAPGRTHAQVRSQLVLGRADLLRNTLDLGSAWRVRPAEQYSLGATAQLVGVGVHSAAGEWFGAGVGGGFWVGRDTGMGEHQVGFLASSPLEPGLSTYGVLVQEAGLEAGVGYRWSRSGPETDAGVSASLSISTVTLLGASIGAHLTQRFADGRVGVKVEGLLGLSENAWLSLGLHWRPTDRVQLGLDVPTALPVLGAGGTVHLTPLLVLRVDAPLSSSVPDLPSLVGDDPEGVEHAGQPEEEAEDQVQEEGEGEESALPGHAEGR